MEKVYVKMSFEANSPSRCKPSFGLEGTMTDAPAISLNDGAINSTLLLTSSSSADTALIPCTQTPLDSDTHNAISTPPHDPVAIDDGQDAAKQRRERLQRNTSTPPPMSEQQSPATESKESSSEPENNAVFDSMRQVHRGSKRSAEATLSPQGPQRKLGRFHLSQLEDVSQDPAKEVANSKAAFVATLQSIKIEEESDGVRMVDDEVDDVRMADDEADDGSYDGHVLHQMPQLEKEQNEQTHRQNERAVTPSLYGQFCRKYPGYKGAETLFLSNCEYVQKIRDRLSEISWDDFVFNYNDYLAYLVPLASRGEAHMSYEEYYHERNGLTVCFEGVITPYSLTKYLGKLKSDAIHDTDQDDHMDDIKRTEDAAVSHETGQKSAAKLVLVKTEQPDQMSESHAPSGPAIDPVNTNHPKGRAIRPKKVRYRNVFRSTWDI